MRRKPGDQLRLFNGRDGEWLATLETLDKKAAIAVPVRLLRPQPQQNRQVHLLFAPLKKARMDILIEKATELGVTHLHPVLTRNTEVRQINEDRLRAQIIEAAEQCERLDIPALVPIKDLTALAGWDKTIPLYACIERREGLPLLHVCKFGDTMAFLIGPEGGFSEDEAEKLAALPFISAVSLGDTVYRAETAALVCLALAGAR